MMRTKVVGIIIWLLTVAVVVEAVWISDLRTELRYAGIREKWYIEQLYNSDQELHRRSEIHEKEDRGCRPETLP